MENLKNVSNNQKPFLCKWFLCKTEKIAKKSLTNFKWAEKGEKKFELTAPMKFPA